MRPCVVMSEPSVSVFEEGFSSAWEKISAVVSEIRTSVKWISYESYSLILSDYQGKIIKSILGHD